MKPLVKLVFAAAAHVTALTAAVGFPAADQPWQHVAIPVGMWAMVLVALGLTVSAARQPQPPAEPPSPYGTGWLGEGTPEHEPSPLCQSLQPDADRMMQPPPCSDHENSYLNCVQCTARRRAFYAALDVDGGTR